jgi:SNF2 family DNA or RNA helicase
MGQVRSVDVHRLLAEDTVDQRMLEILAADVSDLKAADEIGSQVEAERRIIELERKRLRMEAEP